MTYDKENSIKTKKLLKKNFSKLIDDLKKYTISSVVMTGLPVSTTTKFRGMKSFDDYISSSTNTVLKVAKSVDMLNHKNNRKKNFSYYQFFKKLFEWSIESFVRQGTFTELNEKNIISQSQLSKARKHVISNETNDANFHMNTIVAIVIFLEENGIQFNPKK